MTSDSSLGSFMSVYLQLTDIGLYNIFVKTIQRSEVDRSNTFSWSPSNKHDDYFDVSNYYMKDHYCMKWCDDKCIQEKGSKD